MQPRASDRPARALFCTVAAANASIVPICLFSDISLDIASLNFLLPVFVVLAAFMLVARWRDMQTLRTILDCAAGVILAIVPILAWTYAAMNVGMPLADQRLAALDAALGFDWQGFVAFVDARPWLAKVLAESYSSFYFQLLFLPALLALFGRARRAYAMVVAYIVLCLLSSVIGIWYPALGAYVVYDVSQDQLTSINAMFGFHFLEQFEAIRADAPFVLSLDDAAGILTFPSVHAAVAALCAWAAWEVRLLRYPFLVLNIAMAASAVSHGSHYLVDVVAGIGVAGIAVALTLFALDPAAATRLAAPVRRRPALPAEA